MKKFLALLVTAMIIASFAVGCGNSSKAPSTTSGSTGASTSAQTSTAGSETAQPVTLTYLTWDYSDRTKSTDAWIKDLKDQYNITIDMQNIPSDQYPAVLKTHLVSNDMPDLVNVHQITKQFMSEGVEIQPDLFIDLSGLSSVSGFIPSVVDKVKVDGKLYYVPISTNVLGVLYNKKVFSDNSIIIPTNSDEFVAICDKLKAAKIAPMAGGFKDSWITQIIPFIAFSQYIDGKDSTIRNKLADGTIKYTDIKTDLQKVLSIQQDWAQKGYFQDNYLGTDANVASQMVGTGKAAMLICGTWQLKAIKDADPNVQVGFCALPFNAAGEKIEIPSSADGGICISSSGKSIDAAKKALDNYLNMDNQKRVMIDLNGISTNKQVKMDDPFLLDVSNTMAGGEVQPVWWNSEYWPAGSSFQIDIQLQSLLAGGTTIDKFISDFDSANAKALGK